MSKIFSLKKYNEIKYKHILFDSSKILLIFIVDFCL